jgi:Ni,Fe-hydrogenase III small subunit
MFILLRALATIRRELQLPSGDPRWLAIRHVDAGSCNGCEHELGAVSNPYHDLQRHGLDIVASPRHADILLITGPITVRMAGALRIAYDAMPEPRLVAALGDCALGCNVLGDAVELARPLSEQLPIDIRIPGCPPTPDAIAHHLLAALTQAG